MKFLYFLDQPKVKKHLSIIFTGFILGILTYIFIVYIEDRNRVTCILSGILGIIIAYLITLFSKWLNTVISWKKYTGVRLLTGIFFITIIISVLWLTGTYFFKFIEEEDHFLWNSNYSENLLKSGILFFFISLIYNIIYFAIYSYYQYAKGQLITLQLERKQTELQLAALKSQLSPHFLFNSINTISSLLFKDLDKAERFIRKLAHSYQYSLNNYENRLVTVNEELDFVNSYIFLAKTRFGNAPLTFKINVPQSVLNTKIPPLTLQILVENALKHNQVSASKELIITIDTTHEKIRVSNNKTAPVQQVESFKIGLNNITSRYQLLAGKKIEIINDQSFTVNLPLIK